MRRLYQMLLRLYPREHRAQFGDEMLCVFAQAAGERRTQGWSACARFLFRDLPTERGSCTDLHAIRGICRTDRC